VLLLLPPSETKRPGGSGRGVALEALRYPSLTPHRERLLAAVSRLAHDESASLKALGLGPRGASEVAKNTVVATSATVPAVERYTGVLYDALDVASLPAAARAYLDEHVVIHSALFGPVGAGDPIPDYRLSHDSRLPGVRLRALWSGDTAAVLAAHEGVVVDARSEGYVRLGAAPDHDRSVFLRVVTEGAGGQRRALNHFNKRAKGELARRLALTEAEPETIGELIEWGSEQGLRLERPEGRPRELLLVV
jgi:cytoplasmic iron level regulating protein YaaA (DUF328/UPF0246 family)